MKPWWRRKPEELYQCPACGWKGRPKMALFHPCETPYMRGEEK
jgi:hypothetical protein